MWWPFSKLKQANKVEAPEVPAPGEKWEMFDEGDPFPSKYPPVTILNVKDGWVRYSMGKMFFNDERRTVKSFVLIYRKVKGEKN
jgi:hypothetical protein